MPATPARSNASSRRSGLWGLAALAVSAAAVAQQWFTYSRGVQKVVACGAQIELGEPAASASEQLRREPCVGLRLSPLPPGRKGWWASAPLVFGARNWGLVIDTDGSVVTAIRYRTEDSLDEHPASAPPDREGSRTPAP